MILNFIREANKVNSIRVTQAGVWLIRYGDDAEKPEYSLDAEIVKELLITTEHFDQAREIIKSLGLSIGDKRDIKIRTPTGIVTICRYE